MFEMDLKSCEHIVALAGGDEHKAIDLILQGQLTPTPLPLLEKADESTSETEMQMKIMMAEKRARVETAARYMKKQTPPTSEEQFLQYARAQKEEEQRLTEKEAVERRRKSTELKESSEEIFRAEEERWREQLKVKRVDELLEGALKDDAPASTPPSSDFEMAQFQRDAAAFLAQSVRRAQEQEQQKRQQQGDQGHKGHEVSDSPALEEAPLSNERQSILQSRLLQVPLISLYFRYLAFLLPFLVPFSVLSFFLTPQRGPSCPSGRACAGQDAGSGVGCE